MLKARKASGFTLIEVMVAVVILAITAGGVLSLTNIMQRGTFQGTVRSTNSCLTEAQRILGNFKEKSLSRTRFNLYAPVAPTAFPATLRPGPGDIAAQELGLTYAVRWPVAKPVYNTSTNPITIRPYMLIMGYMNSFEAIYTNNNAICATGLAAYGDNSLITPISANSGLDAGATLNVRLQLYDITSGNTVACGTAANIRPRRPVDTDAAIAADLTLPPGLNPGVNYPAGGLQMAQPPGANNPRGDLGFLITVTINHTDRSGRTRRCSVQERFQYGTDAGNPYTLEVEDAETNIDDSDFPEGLNTTVVSTPQAVTATNTPNTGSQPYNRAYSSANPPHYRACDAPDERNLNIRIEHSRSGSIHMCRNMSFERTYPPGDNMNLQGGNTVTFESTELSRKPFYNSQLTGNKQITGLYYPEGHYYCRAAHNCAGLPKLPPQGGTGSTNYDPDSGEDYFFHASNIYNYFYYPHMNTDTRALDTSLEWQPCEQMEVCGVNPTTAGYDIVNTGYNLRYENLPVGCEVYVQIAEIDAAYNVSTAEVREYIQERVPGNKLCWNSAGALGTYPADAWFFACTSTPPFPDCSTTSGPTACCIDFPIFEEYYPYYEYP